MERTQLAVQPRTVVGKKVKQLRKDGTIPGHIYGYQIEPVNIGVDVSALTEIFKHSGETGLIDVSLDGQKYPVLIKEIQRHAVSGDYLNVDFYKVNLKEKVSVVVPIVPMGEPEAVVNKIGILEQPLSEIEIEALPTDLIENIEVDVASLANMDDSLYVKDLQVPATVTIVGAEPEDLVFRIGELMTAEMEEALEAEAAAAEEAQAEEAQEGEEGKEEPSTEEAAAEENAPAESSEENSQS